LPHARWQARCLAQLRGLASLEIVGPAAASKSDVLLDLSDEPLSASRLAVPRFGRWRFVHGPEARADSAALREHLAGERTVMIRLVSISASGAATVLETGVLKCVPHSLSATRERVFEAASPWPARCLARLVAGELGNGGRVNCSADRLPALARTLTPFASMRNFLRRRISALNEEHWEVGFIAKPIQHVIDAFDAREIRWIAAPARQVLADPVGVRAREQGMQVLAEAYDFKDRQGRIVAFEVDAAGNATPPREVLRLPVHASYPHLIEHRDAIYCLPEAHAANRVQLFHAASFPDRWVPDRVLLEGFAGVDPTVVEHEGRWWLFCGNHADQDETGLYLFFADDLFGPWRAHPANPVKCDIRSSRPAGPLFRRGGELFRPAQDCSRTYGGAVAINRILTLTPAEFREETVTRLNPDPLGPMAHGLHSVAGVGNFTFVDGKRHEHPFGARFR
jgi:hypothetical protein